VGIFFVTLQTDILIEDSRMRFLGNIEARTDSKGRVFLPATFRKVLQQESVEHLVLRKDVHEECLILYPDRVWIEQEDFMRKKLNRWNKQEQQIFRQFVSDVELITLDSNGRFLLSQRAQSMAGIKQTVRFVGVGDTIEIWSGDEESTFINPTDFSNALEALLGGKENTSE
jgi:MraZ protein